MIDYLSSDDYSKDYSKLHEDKENEAYTHEAFYTGTDSRSPKGKWKVKLYSKGNYWISSVHLTKYKKKDGLPDGEFPMYRLLLDTIVPINR